MCSIVKVVTVTVTVTFTLTVTVTVTVITSDINNSPLSLFSSFPPFCFAFNHRQHGNMATWQRTSITGFLCKMADKSHSYSPHAMKWNKSLPPPIICISIETKFGQRIMINDDNNNDRTNDGS